MYFLDTRGALRGHSDLCVFRRKRRSYRAAISASHRHNLHFATVCSVNGSQDVFRVATRGDGEEHIARVAERAYLL